jgi:F420 biosynthesis protein FbiB-like protein
MSDKLSLFKELALSRRSLRIYDDRQISKALLQQILTISAWAPSAHNRQPWRFAVVTEKSRQEQLAQAMGERLRTDLKADGVSEAVIAQDTTRSYERITGASVLVCLCMSMVDMDRYPDEERNDSERTMATQSVAMAGQNLLLAAHAAGLGACWMCAPLFCPDVVQLVLELPDDWEPQALLTIGYPAQHRERTREPLEARVLWR